MTVQLQSPEEVKSAEEVARALENYPTLRDPNLSPFQKRLEARRILNRVKGQLAETEKERDAVESLIESVKAFEAWKPLKAVLQKNDCSRLHKLVRWLKRAAKSKHFEDVVVGNPFDYDWKNLQPFIVQHNWAEAFKNAGEYAEGDFNLPFERCAFEFRITGKSVTVLAQQDEGCAPSFRYYVECGDIWLSDEKDTETFPAFMLARDVIKALSVAMDAEVATRTIVRVSEKVNRHRERDGKEPFYSYHVVSLAHRTRVANPLGGVGGATTKKRLHFRRGHWRHYTEFKTWVRWTLVGNPDLGFIDKEYRL